MTLREQDRRTARVALAAGLLFALALSASMCGRRPAPALAQAPRWQRTAALMLAQATVHEADWRAYGDLGAIYMTIEGSRRPGETFAQAIRRRMPNLAAGATPRSWVLGLPAGPILRNPAGWPWRVHASHYSEAWERLQGRAVSLLTGADHGPCEATPVRWVGRVSGRDTLANLLASGEWAEVACGGSANAYLIGTSRD